MAQCFCGCGRKVAFFRRPMNTSGRRVDAALDKIDTNARPLLKASHLPTDNLDVFEDAGWGFYGHLQEIVHGGRHPQDFDQQGVRRWLKLAGEAEPAALLGITGVEMSDRQEAEEATDAEDALPDDQDEAAKQLVDEIARLAVNDFDDGTERILQMGALHIEDDPLSDSARLDVAVAIARSGYCLWALGHEYFGEAASDLMSSANQVMLTTLQKHLERIGEVERSVASACLHLATEEPPSAIAVFFWPPGFDPELRTAVMTKQAGMYFGPEWPDEKRAQAGLLFRYGYVLGVAEDCIENGRELRERLID